MGMGLSEMAVIFLVAFLVLGPSRSIDAARTVGRLLSELRRNFSEVSDAISMERDLQTGPGTGYLQKGSPTRTIHLLPRGGLATGNDLGKDPVH